MIVQIQNTTLPKFNQVQATSNTMLGVIKRNGWVLSDCKITELRDELVNTVYRGVDGKSIPPGKKQYRTRAKNAGSLNTKTSATCK